MTIVWVINPFTSSSLLPLRFHNNSLRWRLSGRVFTFDLLIRLIVSRAHSPASGLSWLSRFYWIVAVVWGHWSYCLILVRLLVFSKVIISNLSSNTCINRIKMLPLAHGILMRLWPILFSWLLLTQILSWVSCTLFSKKKWKDIFSFKAHVFWEFTNNLLQLYQLLKLVIFHFPIWAFVLIRLLRHLRAAIPSLMYHLINFCKFL